MRFLLHRSGLCGFAVAAAVSACGARTGALWDLGAGPALGPGDPGGSPPSSRDGGVAPSGGAPRRLCSFDAPPALAKPVLAVVAGSKISFLGSDGLQKHVTDLAGTTGAGWEALFTNADNVFVAASYHAAPTYGTEQLLLDTSGRIVWHQADSDPAVETDLSQVTFGQNNVVAESMQKTKLGNDQVLSNGLVRIAPDGKTQLFAGLGPFAPADAQGSVPFTSVTPTGEDPMKLGWLHVDGSMHVSSGAFTVLSHLAYDGARFVYLDSAGAHLVLETEAERRSIPLPNALPAPSRVMVAGHWALLGDDVRVDLDSERVETIAGPSGLRRFVGAKRTLDEDGAVFDALRDDYFGGMYRSTDLGKTWQRIGGTTRLASELGAQATNGTYVVWAAMTFGGDPNWPVPPAGKTADVLGDAVEIIPAKLPFRVFQPGMGVPIVSNDGLCVAYIEHPNNVPMSTLKVWDLETDKTIDVVSTNEPIEMRWIEAPAPIRIAR